MGRRSEDLVPAALGLAVAAGAAWLPWYVHRHPGSFGPPRMEFSRSGEIDGEPEDRMGGDATGRLFLRGGEAGGIDRTAVGSVPPKGNRVVAPADQPFPGDAGIEVVLIANRRALIRHGDVFYPVAVNSPLPDGSRVAAFRTEGGEPVLVTSRQQEFRAAR